MDKLVIVSTNKVKMRPWLNVLSAKYSLIFSDNIDIIFSEQKQVGINDLLVLDAEMIKDEQHLPLICQHIKKVVVVGEDFTPTEQIDFIYKGAWGYSDKVIDERLILRTIESVINNEIWLKRQYVPQMMKGIVAKQALAMDKEKIDNKIVNTIASLTRREIEVVEHVYSGEDNNSIAELLNISCRTVKAHLSSIFRKLNVTDRFQLVVFLKDLHTGKMTRVEPPVVQSDKD